MNTKKLLPVAIFAISMAYLESATVVYLRNVFGITDIILDFPFRDPILSPIEIGREFATLVMLFTVGWAAGSSLQSRIGFSFYIFGLWDIFYYAWLWVFIQWPATLLTPDLLFLIPVPWFGPVIAPMLVAVLMVIWSVTAIKKDDRGLKIKLSKLEWAGLLIGILIMLFSFMKDAISILPTSLENLETLKPSSFDWAIFICGYLLSGYCLLNENFSEKAKNLKNKSLNR